MRRRVSLSVKILLLASLNVALLALVFLVFAHVEFRFQLGSFLLASTRDRIDSVSRLIALQLPDRPPSEWDQLLAQYAASYGVELYLFRADGTELAGPRITLPARMLRAVQHDAFAGLGGRHSEIRHEQPGPPPRSGMGPPLFTIAGDPPQYWVGVRIPIWGPAGTEPIHGTLIWRFSSFWTNRFIFDYRPWLAVVLAVIAVCIVCWVPLIRGLTRSITQMTGATGQIAEGHFEIELPTKRRDELGRLSESINRMAQRLSGFVHGQRRFLGDIAHELCSPLARIQVALGILEQRASAEQVEYVSDVREEAEHMAKLVHELLSFSKAQLTAGTELIPVNVAETVHQAIEREGSPDVHIETHVDKEIAVMAQPEYLLRSLCNVLRNASRYAGHAGPIVIGANNGAEQITITVTDNGPGLPEGELENVLKPFYRPEFARQRETGGTGLGLAIVKTCIEACGGTVQCRNRIPHGLEIEMRLQAARN